MYKIINANEFIKIIHTTEEKKTEYVFPIKHIMFHCYESGSYGSLIKITLINNNEIYLQNVNDEFVAYFETCVYKISKSVENIGNKRKKSS